MNEAFRLSVLSKTASPAARLDIVGEGDDEGESRCVSERVPVSIWLPVELEGVTRWDLVVVTLEVDITVAAPLSEPLEVSVNDTVFVALIDTIPEWLALAVCDRVCT